MIDRAVEMSVTIKVNTVGYSTIRSTVLSGNAITPWKRIAPMKPHAKPRIVV
jgi:hypothetical protein